MRKNNILLRASIAIVSIMLSEQITYAQDGKPVFGGAITWGVATEPSCFDPHRSSQQAALFVARNYIDSLVGKRTDGTFAPWLATEWSISPKSLIKGDLCGGGASLAGTGPFVFERYSRGQSVSFMRNKDYKWAPGYAAHNGPAYLDRVTLRFLPEAAVRAGALTSGQVDLIEGVQPTDVALFADQTEFKLLTGPSGASTSFTLNVNYTKPPADDVRVRRALRDGFDLEPLVRQIYLGTVPRAWSIIGPRNPAYNKALVKSWGNDVAGANRLLDEAGWIGRDSEGFAQKTASA